MSNHLILVGGGAAGVFAAIIAKTYFPHAKVTLLEKSATLLAKVRISGGGRCNVTHSCFNPALLTKNYPRGEKELLAPFYHFQPQDTLDWFSARGVTLKTEKDGRIFPTTDQSQTIIDALLHAAAEVGVTILLQQKIRAISYLEKEFTLTLREGQTLRCDKLLLATGSNAEGHSWAKEFGHTIQAPVPSLFTFNSPHSPLKELSGISVEDVHIQIRNTHFSQRGPLLITHFGWSGPAILKLSAWAARHLHEVGYQFEIVLQWLPAMTATELFEKLVQLKNFSPKRTLSVENPFRLPKNLWRALLVHWGQSLDKPLKDFSLKELRQISENLSQDIYAIEGKTTHKEEFVTCGGVSLKEINFKKMESKILPGLFFAGEILDIDGITGGFNFQNAWTTGFLAGRGCFS